MAIDSHYIPAFSIEEVLLDKDTGAPLSGGLVYFEQDNQRGMLKPVYQITGTSPDYTYTQLPNPMTLSSIGTFMDSIDNPIVPYFFPYDSEFDEEYYYVRVTSSEGVEQFTREAVPYIVNQDAAEVLSVITNEISNPQFAVVNFDTSAGAYVYSFGAVTDQVIHIAPDWDLIVSCATSGTVTVTQLKPTGTVNRITNPGTMLTIGSSGLSKLHLRQRLYGSPNLWGSGYLSGGFVAKTYSGTAPTLSLYYSQSNGLVIDKLLVAGVLEEDGSYAQYSGNFNIPVSTSLHNYPLAYVDIYFDIPRNITIDITSVMVAFTGETSIEEVDYDQESLARQVDHLYHYAYPIVPVGTVIDYGGFTVPQHYLLCDGGTYFREEYNLLFQALTTTETVILINTVTTFTVVDSSKYRNGMPLEGNGIQAGTVISVIVGNVITMNLPATIGGSSSVRFFAAGNGNGATLLVPTTFNVFDLRDYVIAGAGGNAISATTFSGVGGTAGAASFVMALGQLAAHAHSTTLPNQIGPIIGGGGATTAWGTTPTSYATTVAGNSDPINLTQLTTFLNKCIRYQ